MPSSVQPTPYTNGHTTNGLTNGHHHAEHEERARDVGILAMEVYFPNNFVDQAELERFDGVSAGKYTIGLGQERMGFCTDREDIVSLCLTAVERLMRRTGTSYADIGRLDVGTETLIDKSKSVKTNLMRLFEESGNNDVEGVDNLNACYGGTAGLFNSLDWMESSAWDGRLALVVAGDIAVYASGNARCTGGAGAVAMLIGPHAPLVFDQGVRSSFMQHAYDFYKPDMASEYPTVDGQLSIRCYMEALDRCYAKYRQKFAAKIFKNTTTPVNLDCLDFMVFHSPFTKLVQKSLSRLILSDFLAHPEPDYTGKHAGLEKYRGVKLNTTFADKDLEKLLLKLSHDAFSSKTDASLMVARNVGNMYTASLYGGLASLISSHTVEELSKRRVGLFSYGSGVAASLFSAHFVPSDRLTQLVESFRNLRQRLDERSKTAPEEFDAILKSKESTHHSAPFTPAAPVEAVPRDAYYLESIDGMHRRQYLVKRDS
ncbi:Hydroxymethylglutaryl-CoA synthase, cytoplasmic [Hypsibius exemplaris]|uniref:Hydroxymethylglutaryl-CoA synthase n=1 Tax=Hypsibius exemplaris TaxID=2072580 RepID=A0A1W0W885_HYPEX|nr:Hydroxymethylglutaryl-CoA synthase, cytoplasmic [Hypsibius exemplaris]